jgi:hypothetical protein
MFLVDIVAVVLYAVMLVPILVFAIASMAEKHSGEIYLIWYIASFFFVLFCVLQVIALNRGVQLTEVCGSHQDDCKAIYDYLTDPGGEAAFIFISFILAIVPQWLTYFLSGLSGSASPPRFMSQFGRLAIWSLVKFAAALSGILAAQNLGEMAAGHLFSYNLFLLSLLAISYAFAVASFHHWFTEKPAMMPRGQRSNRLVRPIAGLDRFFTRNSRVP